MLKHLWKYIKTRHRLPAIAVLCLFAVYISASSNLRPNILAALDIAQLPQDSIKPTKKNKDSAQVAGAPKLIKILNSSIVTKRRGEEYQVLKDSVILYHEGAYLYCDSAYYNETKNSFEAFSKVHMVQGDTILLDGDYLHYDGNTMLAKVRHKVILTHVPQHVNLYTDSLDYDRQGNIGYYTQGGQLIDTLNQLTSNYGQYEPTLNLATFLDNVVLTNPRFVLHTNNLEYRTDTKIAEILSESTIVSDSGTIYTSRGWYNTELDRSMLLDQSRIVNKQGNRTLTGDSIFYNKVSGYGEVFGNMRMQDTAKHVILCGHYALYNEITNYTMATDSAYCIEYSQGDSLFIHADTLKLITVQEYNTPHILEVEKEVVDSDSISGNLNPINIAEVDSISETPKLIQPIDSLMLQPKEELTRIIKAYHDVRFYRNDIQGVCDSMQFSSKDSILHLFRDPILWNEHNQLTGDTIDIHMNDSTIEMVHVKKYSYSIEQKEDSTLFNQLKGQSMKVFFENGTARRIYVEGNAQSIFYPVDEKENTIIGLNKLECSYLNIMIKDRKLERLTAWPTPKGRISPLEMVKPEEKRLPDFYWYDYIRPIDRHDIFRKVSKKATDIRPKRSSVFDEVEEEE